MKKDKKKKVFCFSNFWLFLEKLLSNFLKNYLWKALAQYAPLSRIISTSVISTSICVLLFCVTTNKSMNLKRPVSLFLWSAIFREHTHALSSCALSWLLLLFLSFSPERIHFTWDNASKEKNLHVKSERNLSIFFSTYLKAMSRINCENENNNTDILKKLSKPALSNMSHFGWNLLYSLLCRPGKFTDDKTNDGLMREGIPLDAHNWFERQYELHTPTTTTPKALFAWP